MIRLPVFILILLYALNGLAEDVDSAAYVIDLQTRSMFGTASYELYYDSSSLRFDPYEPSDSTSAVEQQPSYIVQGHVKIVPLLAFDELVVAVSKNITDYFELEAIPVPDEIEKNLEVAKDTRKMMVGHLARMVVTQTFGDTYTVREPVIRSDVKIHVYETDGGERYLLVFNKRVYL